MISETKDLQIKLVAAIIKQQGLYDQYEASTVKEKQADLLLEIQAIEAMKRSLSDRIRLLELED